MSNYFKMDRGVYGHKFFAREAYSRRDAWGWLIASACYEQLPVFIAGKEVVLLRGQLSFSIRFMAEKWKWDKAKVERCLGALKTAKMIETSNEHGQLVITICNYDKYQDVSGGGDTATEAGNETAARQQRDSSETKKKAVKAVKAEKKEDKTPKAPTDLFAGEQLPQQLKLPEWLPAEVWDEFVQHRISRKSKLTDLAATKAIAQLDKFRLEGYSPAEVINHTIVSNWDGLFRPDRGQKNKPATSQAQARPTRQGARTV